MIRVLQCVNNMHRAGLETMLMNYYRNIDRTKIQFDFLTHRPERSDYDDEIERMGGKIYRAPRLYPQNYPAYFAYMRQFFKEHPEYKIVHSHIDSMSYLPLLAAKKAGVPIRIAHSHSSSIDRDLKYPLKQLFRHRINAVSTHRFACGQKAGKFLFRGEDFCVIPNAIDASNFSFNREVREKMRKELGLEGKLVLGHVGRFCYPKNHGFLIEVFEQVLRKEENAVLMLVGTGEKEQEIQEYVQRLGIAGSVLFLGSRSDVNALYQAMDVFVMPSLFEGVPVVGIEAQFSGLPCVFSDCVTQEVKFTKQCVFVDLKQSLSVWADAALELGRQDRGPADCTYPFFDVRDAHKLLVEQYMRLYAQVESRN